MAVFSKRQEVQQLALSCEVRNLISLDAEGTSHPSLTSRVKLISGVNPRVTPGIELATSLGEAALSGLALHKNFP